MIGTLIAKSLLTLTLLSAPQEWTEPEVSLVFDGQVIVMKRNEAQALYDQLLSQHAEGKFFAALIAGLQSGPTPDDHPKQTKEEFLRELACWWCREK